jgi:hypothetical protein
MVRKLPPVCFCLGLELISRPAVDSKKGVRLGDPVASLLRRVVPHGGLD